MSELTDFLQAIAQRYLKLPPSVGCLMPICEIAAVIHALRTGDNIPVLLWVVAAAATLLYYQ